MSLASFDPPTALQREWSSRSERILVDIEDLAHSTNSPFRRQKRFWQFVYVSFTPDAAAKEAYRTHTKKEWNPGNLTGVFEETAFFFEVDERGCPTAGSANPLIN